MKMIWVGIAGYFLAASLCSLEAQSPGALAAYPPPRPPLVVSPPNNAQWTITLTYEGGAATPAVTNPAVKIPRKLHQIVSTKTENLKHDVEIYDDGTSEEYWFVKNLILLPDRNGRDVGIIDFFKADKEHGEAGNPVSSPGFPGVGWIKMNYYDKVASIQGQPCYHYLLKSATPSLNPGSEPITNDIESWISIKTDLPVRYSTGGVTYDYTFGSPPGSDLVLPPKYAQALKAYQGLEDRRKLLENDLGR
jgi:hypothetical protein